VGRLGEFEARETEKVEGAKKRYEDRVGERARRIENKRAELVAQLREQRDAAKQKRLGYPARERISIEIEISEIPVGLGPISPVGDWKFHPTVKEPPKPMNQLKVP
jgi:hypothetical protein